MKKLKYFPILLLCSLHCLLLSGCSFQKKEGIVWHRLNPQKDDTDTEFALRLAISMGAECITVLGGTGSRLDHVLGNIELLGIGLELGVEIELLDANNRIRMTDHGMVLKKEEQFGKYVSLIPYTAQVEHLYLAGLPIIA